MAWRSKRQAKTCHSEEKNSELIDGGYWERLRGYQEWLGGAATTGDGETESQPGIRTASTRWGSDGRKLTDDNDHGDPWPGGGQCHIGRDGYFETATTANYFNSTAIALRSPFSAYKQVPNFCASSVSVEFLSNMEYALHKPKFPANQWNKLDISAEFRASASADYLLTVSRAIKFWPRSCWPVTKIVKGKPVAITCPLSNEKQKGFTKEQVKH